MKKAIIAIRQFLYRRIRTPFLFFMRAIVAVTEKINMFSYKILFWGQWCLGKTPLYMDHNIDLYYLWKKTGNTEWIFRGIFSKLAIEKFAHPNVLELGCADGFNTKYFYRGNNQQMKILACDNCIKAIQVANKKYSASNIKYVEANFMSNMPGEEEHFTNVIWDASMNFFNIHEIEVILANIVKRLNYHQGILTGMAVIKKNEEEQWEHFNCYIEEEVQLQEMLKRYFKYVTTMQSMGATEKGRTYFWASNSDRAISSWI